MRTIKIEDIIKLEVKDGWEGVKKQYEYISSKLGKENVDWHLTSQSCEWSKTKQFDFMEVELLKSKEHKEFIFDITDYFGKF